VRVMKSDNNLTVDPRGDIENVCEICWSGWKATQQKLGRVAYNIVAFAAVAAEK
jgi:hypothetical protein